MNIDRDTLGNFIWIGSPGFDGSVGEWTRACFEKKELVRPTCLIKYSASCRGDKHTFSYGVEFADGIEILCGGCNDFGQGCITASGQAEGFHRELLALYESTTQGLRQINRSGDDLLQRISIYFNEISPEKAEDIQAWLTGDW